MSQLAKAIPLLTALGADMAAAWSLPKIHFERPRLEQRSVPYGCVFLDPVSLQIDSGGGAETMVEQRLVVRLYGRFALPATGNPEFFRIEKINALVARVLGTSPSWSPSAGEYEECYLPQFTRYDTDPEDSEDDTVSVELTFEAFSAVYHH